MTTTKMMPAWFIIQENINNSSFKPLLLQCLKLTQCVLLNGFQDIDMTNILLLMHLYFTSSVIRLNRIYLFALVLNALLKCTFCG
jgi:hypothetical protein